MSITLMVKCNHCSMMITYMPDGNSIGGTALFYSIMPEEQICDECRKRRLEKELENVKSVS